MHTEDEAKKTRCCGPEYCGSNPNFYDRMCIASDCMAWRWAPRDEILLPLAAEVPEPFVKFAETTLRGAHGELRYQACCLKYSDKDGQSLPARGGCGLAGKP